MKVLIGKIGIDGHDRGVREVAYALKEGGLEVLYAGPWQKVEEIIQLALEEDVDLIGISTLGGDHLLVPKLMAGLTDKKMDIPVVVGGIVPGDYKKILEEAGVVRIFPPGSDYQEITEFIRSLVQERV